MSRRKRHSSLDGDEQQSLENAVDQEYQCDTSADLTSLEELLATLRPRDDRLNRDTLIFMAGQASVEQTIRSGDGAVVQPVGRPPTSTIFWRRAFAGMTAVAVTLLALLVTGRTTIETDARQPVEATVHTGQPPVPLKIARRARPKTLSSAPYWLTQIDRLTVASVGDLDLPPESREQVEDRDLSVEPLSPLSIPMLLRESES